MTAKFALRVRTQKAPDVQFQCRWLPVQPFCSFAFAAFIPPALLIKTGCHFFKLAGQLKFLFMFLSKRRTFILHILADAVSGKSWSDIIVTVSQEGEPENCCSLWGFQRSCTKFITERHCVRGMKEMINQDWQNLRCRWVTEGYFWYP